MAVVETRLPRTQGTSLAGGPGGRSLAARIHAAVRVLIPGTAYAPARSQDAVLPWSHALAMPIPERTAAPSPHETCAALIGGATLLSRPAWTALDADISARIALLSSPLLPHHLHSAGTSGQPGQFDTALLDLHPFWIAAVVTVLEHATIASATSFPETIGGYPFAPVVDAARHLASITTPFDRIVPSLDRLGRGEGLRHAS